MDRLLQELEMRRDDVDEVVLVGGTTRVPRYSCCKYLQSILLGHHVVVVDNQGERDAEVVLREGAE